MLLGAMLLIRSPLTSGGVSLGVALAATLPFALLTVFLMRLVLRSRLWKSTTGREELIGAEGVAVSGLRDGCRGDDPRSRRTVARGVAASRRRKERRCACCSVEGLKLYVEPAQAAGCGKRLESQD